MASRQVNPLLRQVATRRAFTTSRPALDQTTPTVVAPSRARRPIGAVRGGFFGFLLGLTAAGGYGYYHLFEEYQVASNLLLLSVEELKSSTQKISNHVRRIERVEKDLKSLQEKATTQEELDKLRSEMKKVYDGLHLELLDTKAHLWGVEQDLQALVKKEGREVQV